MIMKFLTQQGLCVNRDMVYEWQLYHCFFTSYTVFTLTHPLPGGGAFSLTIPTPVVTFHSSFMREASRQPDVAAGSIVPDFLNL